jgi:hypothetical protein
MEMFTAPINSFQPMMNVEERRRLEPHGQRASNIASSGLPLSDRYLAKQQASLSNLPSNENIFLMNNKEALFQSMEGNKTPVDEAYLTENGAQLGQRIDTMQLPRRSLIHPFLPQSAPANMANYPCQQAAGIVSRNSVLSLCPDVATGELGWNVENQTSRFQTSPLLNGNMKFPTRPLIPGVLAKIHNDWLEEYPQPVGAPLPSSILEDERIGNMQRLKRFPTPRSTFESHHIRILWQELERRRILEMSDIHIVGRLRQEARQLLKIESAHYALVNGIDPYSRQEIYNSTPEPSEEQIEVKVQTLGEQTKKSAVYAVGLLRHVQRGAGEGERNGIGGQAAAAAANNVHAAGPKYHRGVPQPEVNAAPPMGKHSLPEGPACM